MEAVNTVLTFGMTDERIELWFTDCEVNILIITP